MPLCAHTCINRGSSWWAECLSGIQEKVVLLKVSRRNWVCLCIALCTVCPWREMWHCTLSGILESRRISFHRNKSKSSKLSFLAHSCSYSLGEQSSFAHFVTCLNCGWQTWWQYYEQSDLEQVSSKKKQNSSLGTGHLINMLWAQEMHTLAANWNNPAAFSGSYLGDIVLLSYPVWALL